jgi:flagellar basal-body rod protein FlgG
MGTVIDVAAVSMGLEMQRIETSAHNIANATTAGFKRQLDLAFAAEAGSGAADVPVAADLTQGRLSQTSDPHHLAITGPGFFAVRNGADILYTRGGAFSRDGEGRLVTAEKWVLQGDGGDVVVKPGEFRVAADGTVIQEDRAIDRVRLVDFAEKGALARSPIGGFVALAGKEGHRVDDAVIRQGYLEMANVDLGHEMLRMMESYRRFEFGQRLIQTYEDMIGGAVRRLGDLQT